MELLNEMKFYQKNGKMPNKCLMEAVYQQGLFESSEEEVENSSERVDVLNKINNDQYIENNYKAFSEELKNNKRTQFLTPYSPDELAKCNVKTFQVPGYEIGFALKPMEDGNVDIISVHNNTDIKGIGEALIDSAKRLGGTQLDHFDGFLSDFYKNKGFEEYERWDWDEQYAPENWDYEKYGRPSVVLRRLKK